MTDYIFKIMIDSVRSFTYTISAKSYLEAEQLVKGKFDNVIHYVGKNVE